MSDAKQVVQNAFWLFMARIITPIASLLVFFYASRYLSVEEIGKYSLILAFIQVSQFISLLGLNAYIVREVAKDKSRTHHFLANMSSIGVAASIALVFIFWGMGIALKYPADVIHAILLLFAIIGITAITLVGDSIFLAHERVEYSSFIGMAEGIARLAASILAIMAGQGFLTLIYIILIFRIIAVFLYWPILKKVVGSEARLFRLDVVFSKELLRVCHIFFGISVCATFLSRVDFVILSKLRGFTELGLYTASYRILEMLVLFTSTLTFAVFPLMARLGDENDKLFFVLKKLVRYLSMILAIAVATIIANADGLLEFIYTNKYSSSTGALQVLILTGFLMGLDQMLSGVFIAKNRQALDLKVLSASACVYVLLLFAVIPLYGFDGAAWATLAAMGFQFGFRLFILRREIFKLNIADAAWKPVLASAVCVWIVSLIPLDLYWMLRILLSGFLYLAALLIFRIIDSEDLNYLKQLFTKKALLP